MKVLFISNLFPDATEPYRGLDNVTLLHHLKEDCEIRVIAPRPSLPWKSTAAKVCREIDKPFEPVYAKALYVPKIGSRINHHLFAKAIAGPMRNLRQTFAFDTILCSWTYPDTAAVAMVAKQMQVPFVGIVQGSDAHVYLRMPLRRPIIVSAMNQSSSAITRSAKLAELLAEAGVDRSKLHPVYNGVDLELFRPADPIAARKELGLAPDLPTLLFVGNFLPVKNPLLLIHAHAGVCSEHKCQLVMIGGGPMENEVRQTADELGFGKHVILAGRKLAPQVARYMQAADLLCMSSENEGVPNVILEAFASGLPVVSTNVGGISEVLPFDFLGKLVPRGNLEGLSAAILERITTPPDRPRIRAHGETFSWRKAADAYLKLLKRSVAK